MPSCDPNSTRKRSIGRFLPFDTDDNDYVSCDYTVSAQPGITRRSIEYAAFGLGGFSNRGCRTRLPDFQAN